jgi:uncharacterized repeat protein (TIGR01451 family)
MIRSLRRARLATGTALVAITIGLVWIGCSEDQREPTLPIEPAELLQQGINAAIQVQDRHTRDLLDIAGVLGTAVGLSEDGQPVIRLYLAHADVEGLPRILDGFPVETVVTGMIVALTDPQARQPRPVPTGVSVGHPDITAGTIGFRVTDGTDVYILSNNHVLANQNNASIGDAALQPGPTDGGSEPADQIGTLHDFVPIDFSGDNQVDAAIALTTTDNLQASTPTDDGYGAPSATTVPASVGMQVQKYGRTTGLTQGEVSEINVTVTVCYRPIFIFCLQSATFVNQIGITPGGFSEGGDSGSGIVTDDANKNPVALLFAGSTSRTLANPIDAVLSAFGVTIDAGGPPLPPEPDVAISDVSAPASATVGDVVSVDVTVENVGGADATTSFDVTLTDQFDSGVIGTQSVGSLGAGATTVLTFSWNTTGEGLGDHTLNAAHDFSDTNTANDQNSTTVTIQNLPPPADIAISDVSAPASATVGDMVSVDVTVENVGGENATSSFDVTLTDEFDAGVIGTQAVGSLAAGATTVLTFTWNTSGEELGSHTLSAAHDFSDGNTANDQNSTAVTIEDAPPPAEDSHVGDLDGSSASSAFFRWRATVTIRVHDDAHNAVQGATVSGSWSSGASGGGSCTTDASGSCSITSGNIWNFYTSATFNVSNVTHSTLTYNSGKNHDPDGDSNGTSITISRP